MKYSRNVTSKPHIFRNSSSGKLKQKKQVVKKWNKYTYLYYVVFVTIIFLAFYNIVIHKGHFSKAILSNSKQSFMKNNIQNLSNINEDHQKSYYITSPDTIKENSQLPKVSSIDKSKLKNLRHKNNNISKTSKKIPKPTAHKEKTNYKNYVHPDDPIYDENEKYQNEKYVKVIIGKKTGVRQDRRVVFPESDFIFKDLIRPPGEPSNILGRPRALIEAERILISHPLHLFKIYDMPLDETMEYIQSYEKCIDKPIFLTMATVGDDLYCDMCKRPEMYKVMSRNIFPCYNYEYEYYPAPSVMEQIAGVKLYHIPKALSRGVNVFMLDLDVGFLSDPMHMVKVFVETPSVDIFVQEDMLFVMNRSRAGWKTWNTEPLPNIGLFLCRGNNRTRRMFDLAWDKYQDMEDDDAKRQPGKDQNHVLEAMRFGRVKFGLRYAYFSNYTAVLLDKFNLLQSRTIELGGEVAANLLENQRSIAMHTTCYEQSTKVMGLKATNAFWNPKYYDPLRPTITKQLLYINEDQLLDEVRSLVWLGIVTNRSVIIPNILGMDDMTTVPSYQNNILWPGFRVTKLKRFNGKSVLKIDILEPSFYWRVARDYDITPIPSIIWYNNENIHEIKEKVIESSESRIVLHSTTDINQMNNIDEFNKNIIEWAESSISKVSTSYSNIIKTYNVLPSIKNIRKMNEPMIDECLQGMRNCMNIFGPLRGNRTCFQICD